MLFESRTYHEAEVIRDGLRMCDLVHRTFIQRFPQSCVAHKEQSQFSEYTSLCLSQRDQDVLTQRAYDASKLLYDLLNSPAYQKNSSIVELCADGAMDLRFECALAYNIRYELVFEAQTSFFNAGMSLSHVWPSSMTLAERVIEESTRPPEVHHSMHDLFIVPVNAVLGYYHLSIGVLAGPTHRLRIPWLVYDNK